MQDPSRLPPLATFAEVVASLSAEQRLLFYESLAHHLTVAGRHVWSDEELDDATRLNGLKWLNEILHTFTALTSVERLSENEWTPDDVAETIAHCIAQAPEIDGPVQAMIASCIQFILGEETEGEGT